VRSCSRELGIGGWYRAELCTLAGHPSSVEESHAALPPGVYHRRHRLHTPPPSSPPASSASMLQRPLCRWADCRLTAILAEAVSSCTSHGCVVW
jgi:hypothetical protein